MIIFSVSKFLLSWIVFLPIIYFRPASFLKAVNFLQLSFVSSMCQCFIKISFKLDNVCLYVTDTGIHFLSLRFCGRVVVFDQVS